MGDTAEGHGGRAPRDQRELLVLRQANVHLESGNAAAAISVLTSFIKEGGKSSKLSFALGRAHEEASRPEQARWSYDEAIRLGDGSANAFLAAGRVRVFLKRYDEAAHRFQKAVAIDPRLVQGWLLWGIVNLEERQFQEAIEKFDEVVNRAPRLGQAHLLAAEALIRLDRPEDALERYELAIGVSDEPSDSTEAHVLREALIKQGQILQRLERHHEAAECYERLLNRIQRDAFDGKSDWELAVHISAAASALQLKRYTNAKEHAMLILGTSPAMDVYGHLMLAGIASAQGDYRSAWRAYTMIHDCYVASEKGDKNDHLVVGPSPEILELLVEVFAALQEYDDAQDIVTRICVSDDGRKRASAWMRSMSLNMQRRDQAFGEDFRSWHWKALEAARFAEQILLAELKLERSAQSLQDLGILLVALEDWQRGEPYLREALELDPSRTDVRATLAIACAGRGELKEAAAHLRTIVASDPERLEDRVRLGEVLQMQDALDAAEDELRSVLAVTPLHVRAQLALAQVLLARGERGEETAYAEAASRFNKAILLSEETAAAAPAERRASEFLGRRRLSEALYAQAYATVKDSETQGLYSIRPGSHRSSLEGAEKLFDRAAKADPSNFRAVRAAQTVREHRVGGLAPRLVEEAAAPIIAAASLISFLLVQSSFFFGWPYRGKAQGGLESGYYAMLTFGFLALTMAACYLPHVLKLKVAGVELEKEAREPVMQPLSLGISRGATRFDLGTNIIPSERPESSYVPPIVKSGLNVDKTVTRAPEAGRMGTKELAADAPLETPVRALG